MMHKFRIWDDDNKCFSYIDFENLESTAQDLDSFRDYFSQDYIKSNPEFLQWFSGMKDKNNRDIYEGDRVRTDEAGWVAIVVFERGMFCCKDDKGGFSSYCNWEAFEVIGNIYEEV